MVRPVLVVALALHAAAAQAAIHQVPGRHPTIQEAIDAAAPGDTVVVFPGRHCGAVVTKMVSLLGRGMPVIEGCAGGPALGGVLRVGFLLDGAAGASPASGTRITGFRFDGAGVSSLDTAPLAFGVLARFASDVSVVGNRFQGTVQAITNTGGDRWSVTANQVRGLTLLDCADGGLCGGGAGIVFQVARGALAAEGGDASPANRPEGNRAAFNDVAGSIPAGFDVFSMAGVLLMSADDATVLGNRLAIQGDAALGVPGEGVLVTNACCGIPEPTLPGTRDALVVLNDGRRSDYVLVVEGGPGENSGGLLEYFNLGAVLRLDLEPPSPTPLALTQARAAAQADAVEAAPAVRTVRTFQ